jgi:hypothetical protein
MTAGTFLLQTLVVLLSNQLKHPADARYHRLNLQNASVRRLVVLPGADAVVSALGFEADAAEASATYRRWRGGGAARGAEPPSDRSDEGGAAQPAAALPSELDLELIRCHRDLLSQRLERINSAQGAPVPP